MLYYRHYMDFFIHSLQQWIAAAGGFGVFGASIVEEIVSLIPSSMVQMAAGIFIMNGDPVNVLSILKLIFQISIPAALGVTIGSLPYVWLARKFGIKMIDRWGKWIGVSVADIRELEEKLAKTSWDDVAFVAMRAFPVIPSVALAVYGGMIEMSWWRYMTLSFIGVFIRATGLGIIGWLFGNTIDSVSSDIGRLENIGLVVLGIFLISLFWWIKRRKKSIKVNNN
jgi:membrane protein DedA with SNARE-associated domain